MNRAGYRVSGWKPWHNLRLRPLGPSKEKVALVTGSISGIGLGIARALAAAGAAVVLNGFGKPEDIKAVQQAIGSDFDVPVAYPVPTCRSRI